MKRFIAALSITILAGAVPALAAFDDLEKSWVSFYATGLDPAKAMSVDNLTLQKDVMTLVLKKGILVPMQPIEGEITGAMFMGEGTATLVPPTPMDTWFLKKYYGADKFTESFTALYMRFSDGTDKTIPKPVEQAVVASQMDNLNKLFADRQAMANGWQYNIFDMDLDFLDTRIGGIKGQDFFYAQMQTEKLGWVTFLLNYGSIFEVRLGHERTVGMFKDYLPWAEFHKQADYKQGHYVLLPVSDSKEVFDISKTALNISIPTTKTVEIDANLAVSSLVDSLGTLRFDLLNQFGAAKWTDTGRPITVLGVTDASGTALPYIHKRNELLIRLPKPLGRGEAYIVNVKIKEDTIIQVTAESYVLYNTYPWYPQYGYLGGRFAFDFNIEIQKPLTPIGSGHIVRQWENKETKMNGIQLKLDDQVSLASILFGRFQQEKGVYHSNVSNKDINLTVFAYPVMNFEGGGQVNIPQGKMKDVLEESQAIIKFYEEELYGPYPFGDLNVVEMYPGSGYGQAPPALVQLDGYSFLGQDQIAQFFPKAKGDFLHGLLSHEIGHQYWAHVVGWPNDHDQWLSESFAEYSSGIYLLALQGPRRFAQQLDEWRKSARPADPHGPIALANILSGDVAGPYRDELLYAKGPLVVHMIRCQMGDDNFKKAMKQVLSKWKGQSITTEMLSVELSNVSGYNWDYFFDQWYRGVGIPEIHTQWKTTPKEGKYLFEMTVTQKDAVNFKKVFLPVAFKGSGKDQVARKDFPVGKQGQVLQAMLPFDPKSVEVDPDACLLADYVQDK